MPNSEDNLLAKFSAAATNPTPVVIQPDSNAENTLEVENNLDITQAVSEVIPQIDPLSLPKICFQHPDIEGKYFCRVCLNWRCSQCVNVYGGVAVCPNSDSFCFTAQQLAEQPKEKVKLSYTQELIEVIKFPIRKWKSFSIIWLIIWVLAAMMETASDIANTPKIHLVLIGPWVGVSASFISYLVLSGIATQYLINRVQGQESLKVITFHNFTDNLESTLLWVCAATMSFSPIIIYIAYEILQTVLVSIIAAVTITPKGPGIKFYVISALLSFWAMIFYPLSLAMAGLQRSFLGTINPWMSIKVWLNFKPWLKAALAIFFSLHLVTFLLFYFFWTKPFGLIICSLSLTLSTITSFISLGKAIERGCEKQQKNKAN